jgi:signal peptidase I
MLPRFGEYAEPSRWRRGDPNNSKYLPPPEPISADGRPLGPDDPPYGGEPVGAGAEVPEAAPATRRRRKKPLWKELLTLAAVALLLTFLIQQFLGRVYSIPSGSMEKTLHGCPTCDNDGVLVDKLSYALTDPEPGDVVVFEGPDSWTDYGDQQAPSGNFVTNSLQQVGALVGLAPPDERDFVKRVIAVGGQTVQCCDPKGRVLVNGRALDEPYIYWDKGKPNNRQHFDPIVVPKGTLWVMGDNRNNSRDSRFQGGGGLRGVVPIANVIGKARSIVLPPARWQGVGDHNPQGGGGPVALGVPAWQQGLPAGVGLIAAWPMLWFGRRTGRLLRRRT